MYELKVEGMSCGHCVATVTRSVQALDQSANVAVDLPSQTVRVETGVALDAVRGAIEEAGYPVKSAQ